MSRGAATPAAAGSGGRGGASKRPAAGRWGRGITRRGTRSLPPHLPLSAHTHATTLSLARREHSQTTSPPAPLALAAAAPPLGSPAKAPATSSLRSAGTAGDAPQLQQLLQRAPSLKRALSPADSNASSRGAKSQRSSQAASPSKGTAKVRRRERRRWGSSSSGNAQRSARPLAKSPHAR